MESNGPTDSIETTVQKIPSLPGIVDFVNQFKDRTVYTFKKGVKLTVKPKKIFRDEDKERKNPIKEIPIAIEISKITIRNGGRSIDLVEPIEWRQQGKTSKKRSFGTGTRVLIQTALS